MFDPSNFYCVRNSMTQVTYCQSMATLFLEIPACRHAGLLRMADDVGISAGRSTLSWCKHNFEPFGAPYELQQRNLRALVRSSRRSCRPSTLPEVAFAGRSNVGKSSMLNALFGRKAWRKSLRSPARRPPSTSSPPKAPASSDLPGYGYARVAKSEKGRWAELIEGYFNQDRNFALVVSLVDIRHEAQQLDLNMINFLMEAGLPFAVVLTRPISSPATSRTSRCPCCDASSPCPRTFPCW